VHVFACIDTPFDQVREQDLECEDLMVEPMASILDDEVERPALARDLLEQFTLALITDVDDGAVGLACPGFGIDIQARDLGGLAEISSPQGERPAVGDADFEDSCRLPAQMAEMTAVDGILVLPLVGDPAGVGGNDAFEISFGLPGRGDAAEVLQGPASDPVHRLILVLSEPSVARVRALADRACAFRRGVVAIHPADSIIKYAREAPNRNKA
jgi:hypothetical protein